MNYLPDSLGAYNVGEFPQSPQLVEARAATLTDIFQNINSGGNRHLPLEEALSRFHGEAPHMQIVASYLGVVAHHAASLEVPWFQVDNSPLVKVAAAISKRNRIDEGGLHVDYSHSPNQGIRLLVVNQSTTEIEGIPDLQDGQIARTVHGRTWHHAPAFRASSRAPRLLITTDFFLYDPR